MVDNAVQRRLAAIVVADVVGYSRLMEADEAGTLGDLKRLRKEILDPVVRAHGGRIVKIMGDGVLVEFTSAVKAVEAAIQLQENFAAANEGVLVDRRVILRIGINLGDVIGEGSDIYGDGVNVAARLEALAEPGGLCLSGNVAEQIMGKLALSLEDLGEKNLKNIARPVRVFRCSAKSEPAASKAPKSNSISVAVLPFANMSGDLNQEHFVDGLTEDLITALSKSRHLAVVARNSAFQFKNRHVDVQAAGRQLGARYILEGSARTSGTRVRVTAQLIDAEDGMHVWAERFDRDLADIFAVQDEIVGEITGQLSYALIDAVVKAGKARPTHTFSAYDHLLLGRAAWRRGDVGETLDNYRKSAELDPTFAAAHACLAFIYAEDITMQVIGIEVDELDCLARNHAEKAVTLNDGDAFTHHMTGTAYMCLGRHELAQKHLEASVRLNPHFPSSTINLGCCLAFMGDPTRGLALIDRVFSIESRLPPAMRAVPFYVHCMIGEADAALADLARIEAPYAFLNLIAAVCLAEAGRMPEAEAQRAEFEAKRSPWYDIPGFAKGYGRMLWQEPSRARFLSGLRQLGYLE